MIWTELETDEGVLMQRQNRATMERTLLLVIDRVKKFQDPFNNLAFIPTRPPTNLKSTINDHGTHKSA